MNENWNKHLNLPAKTESELEAFCHQARTALGSDLVSIILYGDALNAGSFKPGTDRLNVLLLLKQVNVGLLDKIAKAANEAARKIQLSPFILSEADLRSSTDVFPIKFIHMQNQHVVLFGVDALKYLEISKIHLRLRCEQELKNLTLRMRLYYLQTSDSPKRIKEALSHEIASFLNSISAALILKSDSTPATKTEIATKSAELLGLDGSLLTDLLEIRQGTRTPDADELKSIYDRFMRTVHQAANAVDQW